MQTSAQADRSTKRRLLAHVTFDTQAAVEEHDLLLAAAPHPAAHSSSASQQSRSFSTRTICTFDERRALAINNLQTADCTRARARARSGGGCQQQAAAAARRTCRRQRQRRDHISIVTVIVVVTADADVVANVAYAHARVCEVFLRAQSASFFCSAFHVCVRARRRSLPKRARALASRSSSRLYNHQVSFNFNAKKKCDSLILHRRVRVVDHAAAAAATRRHRRHRRQRRLTLDCAS